MPVSPTYPGVYVEELPSTVHTITGVSTAVTAFVGYFLQGPMNTATQIFSVADLERTFGPLVSQSEVSYAIRQFFANGGAEAWVVRVAGAAPPVAPATTPVPAAAATIQIEDKPSGTALLQATAASPGSWGNNVRLTVDYNTSAPGSSFNLTVAQVDTANPPNILASEVYRNLTLATTDANFAPAVVNAASALIQLKFLPAASTTLLPEPSGTVGSADLTTLNLGTTTPTALTGTGQTMTVTFGGPGATALTTTLALPSQPTTTAGLASALQAQIAALGSPPAIPGVTVTVVPGTGTKRFLQIIAPVPGGAVAGELTFSGGLATTLGLASPTSSNMQAYGLGITPPTGETVPEEEGAGTLVAGSDGWGPGATSGTPAETTLASYASALIGDQNAKTGIYALENVTDTFNILSIPDVMNLDDASAFAVISAAEGYCASKWAFYLVDVPQVTTTRDTPNAVEAWLDTNATLRSSHAAVYVPRPQIPDPVNNYRLRTVAPSGTIAGLYATTDGSRGVWKAPAGTTATLTNVTALAYVLNDAENGALNPLAINCLRSLPVYGNVCWGARTLNGADVMADQWKYVPVRRMALYIENSLYLGTKWVVFEPNDEPLWAQIRLNVGAFMRGLFQQGAFQGSTPAAAYFVKCDSETTTTADINLGIVNVIVGFAPLKPAEFVVLQIQQIAGQIPT